MGHMFSNLVELKFVDPFLWGAPIPIYIWPNAVHFHLLWKRKGIKSFCLPQKKIFFFDSVLESSALSADAIQCLKKYTMEFEDIILCYLEINFCFHPHNDEGIHVGEKPISNFP